MNSESIKTELNQTIKRLNELTEMQKDVSGNLQTLQQGFVSGKTSLDELQAEQGKLTALNGSIAALQAKQTELETELKSAESAELRQTSIQQMEKLANESELAFNDYLALRVETDAIFAESAQKLVNKSSEWRKKQSRFSAIARENDLTQAEIKSVPNVDSATITTYSVPELAFGVAVSAAESILISKLVKEAKSREQAAFNERRFKRQDELSAERMSVTENVLEYRQTA
jgi:predicted nuclease with TOPRIM domain